MTNSTAGTPSVPFYKNPDYLLLVSAQGLSLTGREIGALVLPLLVLGLTGSPAQVGFIAAAQSAPYLFLGLVAGALVDRWDRRRVMITCDAVRVLAFASLPLAWLAGGLHLIQLYAVALTTGVAFVFYNIAEISSLPQIVEHSELTRATTANTVVEWIAENAGPALGGVLMGLRRSSVAGAMLAYGVQTGILFVSLVLLVFIRRPMRPPGAGSAKRSLLKDIGAGMAWLFAHPQIRTMAFLAMALSVIFGPVTLAMIVLARDEFHAGPAAIGLMFSAGGFAGLASTLSAPWVRERIAVGWLLVSSVAIWTVGLIAIAASSSMLTLGLAWLILPGVSGVQDVVGVSYRLSLIPADLQGRVNSVFRFLAWGIRPATLAGGGLLIAGIGARAMLWLLAAAMAATALAAFASPLRKAR